MPDASDRALPAGTATFLFTDIEGATRLLQQVGRGYPAILAEHHRLIRAAVGDHLGAEVKTEGDAFFVAFSSAGDGIRAAVAAQRAIAATTWPLDVTLRVRMGLHTGEADRAGHEYVGLDVHRAARIAAAAHGGQVLISESTRQLVADSLPAGVTLADMGRHRLKDLDRAENLYQLVIEGLPGEFPPIRSLASRLELLPRQSSEFIGRETELGLIGGLLERTRLLTLTGPGGTGKTSLSIQTARLSERAFPDGVAFVPLAPISDAQLVAGTIRQTLELGEELGRSSVETVAARIDGSRVLLILDNFEQVLGAADVVAGLLERTHGPKILVTSRSPLHLGGEQEFPVPPLRLPGAREGGDIELLARSEAVALFMSRAAAVRPDLRLGPTNATAIVQICARLEGLPLAIELAASRVRILPLEALLSRLERSLDVLRSSGTDLTDRQRTLRGTIDWSYDLLDEADQSAFRRLAIFVGGWDLEDAVAVVASGSTGEAEGLDVLERLMDQSLVRQDARSGEPRFGMLESIREYGREQLANADELEPIGRAHALRFLEMAIELGPMFTAAPDSLDRAARQHDNLRAALRWAIDHDDHELALEAVGALWRFWHLRGHLREGRRWASEVLAAAPSVASHGRTRALNGLGGLAYWLGDYGSARRAYEAMLADARSIGDLASEAEADYSLGYSLAIDRDRGAARAAYRESGRIAGLIDDRTGVANAIGGVALMDLLDGRYAEARDGMQQAVTMFNVIGDRWLYLNAKGILSRALQFLGQHDAARVAALEQLDGSIDIGDGTLTALSLHILASVGAQAGDFERAIRLEGASRALHDQLGGGAPDVLVLEAQPDEVAAAAGVARSDIQRWLAQGSELDIHEAAALAHEPIARRSE